jgi:4,5-dihydroxyphthalate decarboxylase
MATTPLKTAIATYPHTQALKEGKVDTRDLEFDFIEVSPITRAFRRTCNP